MIFDSTQLAILESKLDESLYESKVSCFYLTLSMSMFKLGAKKREELALKSRHGGRTPFVSLTFLNKRSEKNCSLLKRTLKKMWTEIAPNFVNFSLSTKLDFKDASKEKKSPSFKDNKSITDGW